MSEPFKSTEAARIAAAFNRCAAKFTAAGLHTEAAECLFEARQYQKRADDLLQGELEASVKQAAIRGRR